MCVYGSVVWKATAICGGSGSLVRRPVQQATGICGDLGSLVRRLVQQATGICGDLGSLVRRPVQQPLHLLNLSQRQKSYQTQGNQK